MHSTSLTQHYNLRLQHIREILHRESKQRTRLGNKEEDGVKDKSYIQGELIDISRLIDNLFQKLFKKRNVLNPEIQKHLNDDD